MGSCHSGNRTSAAHGQNCLAADPNAAVLRELEVDSRNVALITRSCSTVKRVDNGNQHSDAKS